MTDGTIQVLVQWQGLDEADNTWESEEVMKQQFPLFDLEDKVLFEGEGNDEARFPVTYIRRNKAGVDS